MERNLLNWCGDLLSALQYGNGFTHPRVTWGYFENEKYGILQQMFFEELLLFSFHRTPWQLVFPGQTAGLVRTAAKGKEHHVRFYDDGVIDAEEEQGCFSTTHFIGEREHRLDILEGLLKASQIERDWGDKIRPLFRKKEYSLK